MKVYSIMLGSAEWKHKQKDQTCEAYFRVCETVKEPKGEDDLNTHNLFRWDGLQRDIELEPIAQPYGSRIPLWVLLSSISVDGCKDQKGKESDKP